MVATPIGNLEDITLRAVEILRASDLIACEDTRHTGKLLAHHGIHRPTTSYHDFNEGKKAGELMKKLAGGARIALVSDAGTPTLSDPGYRLIRLCRESGVPVVPIPGPSAAIAALSVSGLPTDEFLFAGFLPSKTSARLQRLRELSASASTLVFYEAPHRIDATLTDMQEILGDREVFVARELTKVHEQGLCGRLSEVRLRIKPLGEFVIVLRGAPAAAAPSLDLEGMSRNEALKAIAERLGVSRRHLYETLFRKG